MWIFWYKRDYKDVCEYSGYFGKFVNCTELMLESWSAFIEDRVGMYI